jgi:hypothetical protein
MGWAMAALIATVWHMYSSAKENMQSDQALVANMLLPMALRSDLETSVLHLGFRQRSAYHSNFIGVAAKVPSLLIQESTADGKIKEPYISLAALQQSYRSATSAYPSAT